MDARIVSFDCAGTLLETEYTPEGFAMRAARLAGFEPDPSLERRYRELFGSRWRRFVELNVAQNAEGLAEFWRNLTRDWVSGSAIEGAEERLLAAADDLLYHPDHRYFRLFPDVLPCLDALREAGYRLIILSNWDVTLPRILSLAGISSYFERAFASLVFGMEKPDARFFRHAETEIGAGAQEIVHIGDRMDDDLEGARAAGWKALLLDRALSVSGGDRLARLTDLPPLLAAG